jgi:hypothetical protein
MWSDPFFHGLLLSSALNLLAVAAALALGLRAKLLGRAELAMATVMLWNFLVMVPVYVLGLTDRLEARTLAIVSALWFLGVLIAIRGGRSWYEFAAELAGSAGALLTLPVDAVRWTLRARSLALVGVVFALVLLGWTFGCAYLTPSWKQWDALWYHEPMIGFTIQNQGFRFVDLPVGPAQKVNGYPRLCEMTQLWFVIFTDRRVIDMASHVAAPPLALGVYALARRYTRDLTVAIGCGCALLMMPACAILLGSTYVDVHNAAFVVAAAYFATRPLLRLSDAAIASICLSLAAGSKPMALVPVALLSLLLVVRLAIRAERRPWATFGTIALGILVVVGMAATTYLRNWLHFGNPFWPDLKYVNPTLGINWPGLVEWGSAQFDKGTNRIDMNLPLDVLLRDLYRIPYSVPRTYYGQTYEYGLGVAWVALPLALVAVLGLGGGLVRHLLGRVFVRCPWHMAPETRNLLPLAATLVVMLYFSPALWSARYQVAAVGLALPLVAWLTGRIRACAFGQGVVGCLVVMGVIGIGWETPRYWLRWSEAAAFARIPFPEREVTPAMAIGPDLPIWNGSPATTRVGLARETELGPGQVLVFPDDYGAYLALFWNNQFSNRAVYVPWTPDFLKQAEALEATWIYCATADVECRKAASLPSSGWVELGPLDVENRGSVFRRRRGLSRAR